MKSEIIFGLVIAGMVILSLWLVACQEEPNICSSRFDTAVLGSVPGDPLWNYRLDFDKDDEITTIDFAQYMALCE